MGRKSSDSEASRWALLILLLIGLASCSLVYMCISVVFRPKIIPSVVDLDSEVLSSSMTNEDLEGVSGSEEGECCKGIENLELWGAAVKWGSDFKFNTSEECCQACKAMCSGGDGPCLCDTWVFCGSRETCGPKFGECWLKKQRDTLAPDHHLSGEPQIWTSGLIFGKGEGIIGLETEYGVLHIKLFPDCAPHSVAYILELLGLHHCAGCQLYRAEGRGSSWDSEGNHISNAPLGPPFALLQGTLEAQGTTFKKIPTEACPAIRRGSVAWVGSGPEFFISLANHDEWKKAYTVFGSVLPEDMEIAEKIAQLPTKPDLWNNIEVSVLEKPIPLSFRRIKMSHGDLNLLNGS
ncbi:PREDICTED: uncharacterized protein LOC104606378 [Nelumbo nucifera]|uniref:Uncharacterized protein LOC104606378 n=1 Tax=Nelumbo nucifera TaxID=4432 RepID=A0A1U8AQA8_NELNU|nr:PREDICTED: uncharacterized protein LOC104606378 [Nelumbo nucifera]